MRNRRILDPENAAVRALSLLALLGALGCDDASRVRHKRVVPDGEVLPPDAAPVPDGGPSAPGFLATEILGLPTANSVTVSLVPEAECEAFVEHGSAPGDYSQTTTPERHPGEVPFVIRIAGLSPDTRYHYRVRWRAPGSAGFSAGPEHTFHTARSPGQAFVFTVQADPHLDNNSDLALYRQALANQLADAPDFMIDLGDTFMGEKYPGPFTSTVQMAPDRATVFARYLYERGNFGLVAHSVPLFLVNGNHEGEAGWLLDGTAENLAVWTTLARKAYYFAPLPDGFYTGSLTEEPFVGSRGSYYAWHWGDALFVTLDPYWYTTKKSNQDAWVWSLGAEQYQWLVRTLAGSTAAFRFVFIHNLVGGLDGQIRGGIEAAPFYEWGGANPDGTAGFAAHRPGWEQPIHQLLVDHHVTAVFHGHDHVYVKQHLDGIVYQELPQPSAPNFNNGPVLATEAHYTAGTVVSSSGHLRVEVAPTETRVSYVRAYRAQDENGKRHNLDVSDAYILAPR